MQQRSVRLALLAATATLFVVGPTLSQPRVAPQPRIPAVPVATAPGAASVPEAASAPSTACASGTDLTYTQPASMAPVTNRSTCRHQGRRCCDETRDWCLSEGFLWRDCKNCYCGAQCMGPSLVD